MKGKREVSISDADVQFIEIKRVQMKERRDVSISDARKNLPSLVRDAERGLAVTLTRRGEAVAVLISIDQYRAYAKSSVPSSLPRALDDFRNAFDLDELNIETVYEDVRVESEGRAAHL